MAEMSDKQKERLSGALRQIMEPEVLQEFVSLWPDKRGDAFDLVGLEEGDTEDFRNYLQAELPEDSPRLGWWWI